MKFLVLNGPNLNLLGEREPDIYGERAYSDLVDYIEEHAKSLGCEVEVTQSNFEGELIDAIQQAHRSFDGLVINAGAYSHYSYAIADAIAACRVPAVEVHISNIYAREKWRSQSVVAPVCIGQISGLGFLGYRAAVDYLISRVRIK